MRLTIFDRCRFLKNMDAEKASGTIMGVISGVITSYSGLDLFVTFIIALVTGFLGAAGAHLFKIIARKVQERRNKNVE